VTPQDPFSFDANRSYREHAAYAAGLRTTSTPNQHANVITSRAPDMTTIDAAMRTKIEPILRLDYGLEFWTVEDRVWRWHADRDQYVARLYSPFLERELLTPFFESLTLDGVALHNLTHTDVSVMIVDQIRNAAERFWSDFWAWKHTR